MIGGAGDGGGLQRNATAADNTEGTFEYSDRRRIPIGRCGSAESQLMRAWLM